MIRFQASSWSPVIFIYYKGSIGCSSEILKRTPKGVPRSCFVGVAPAGDRLRSNTLRDTKTAFLNLKSSTSTPSFLYGSLPPGFQFFFSGGCKITIDTSALSPYIPGLVTVDPPSRIWFHLRMACSVMLQRVPSYRSLNKSRG